MDRFEILKYSILLEEYFKKQITTKIIYNSIENSFDDIEVFNKWKDRNQKILSKFGKKNSKMKDTIFHCSAKELIELFKILKYGLRNEIKKESFLHDFIRNTKKFKTILTGNKLVRDMCAHPTIKWRDQMNTLTVFTFLDGEYENNLDRIINFYKNVKKHI